MRLCRVSAQGPHYGDSKYHGDSSDHDEYYHSKGGYEHEEEEVYKGHEVFDSCLQATRTVVDNTNTIR